MALSSAPIPPPVRKVRSEVRQVVHGFAGFIQERNISSLAIGVVIGTAINDLVKAIVDGLLTPFISLISPGGRLANYQVTVYDSVFKVGQVVNAVLNFLLIAAVVYVAVKYLIREESKKE